MQLAVLLPDDSDETTPCFAPLHRVGRRDGSGEIRLGRAFCIR